jgi:hypothetical protein
MLSLSPLDNPRSLVEYPPLPRLEALDSTQREAQPVIGRRQRRKVLTDILSAVNTTAQIDPAIEKRLHRIPRSSVPCERTRDAKEVLLRPAGQDASLPLTQKGSKLDDDTLVKMREFLPGVVKACDGITCSRARISTGLREKRPWAS